MKFFAVVAFFAFVAAAQAGLLAPALTAYSAPAVVSGYAAPWAGAGLVGEQTIVAGPSGTVATGRTLAAPAWAGPVVSSYAAPGLVARAIW